MLRSTHVFITVYVRFAVVFGNSIGLRNNDFSESAQSVTSLNTDFLTGARKSSILHYAPKEFQLYTHITSPLCATVRSVERGGLVLLFVVIVVAVAVIRFINVQIAMQMFWR